MGPEVVVGPAVGGPPLPPLPPLLNAPETPLLFQVIPSYEYSYLAGFTEETLKFLVLYFYKNP